MIGRIGIDFGTSTTVLRVKNYEDDEITPIQDRLGTQSVQFSNNQTIPTIVRIFQDERENLWGLDSENERPKSELIMNFKMDLVSKDTEKQQQAKKLTEGFFCYLYDHFKELNDISYFGDQAQRIDTIISYPVKWSADLAKYIIEAASKAHFPNVVGMNEAKAAVISAILQNQEKLEQIINEPSRPHRLLLIDMGAGTTDIIYGECSFRNGSAEWKTILCWPQNDSSLTCGGREIDLLMKDCIEKILRDYGEKTGETENYLKRLNNDKNLPLIRRWKEKDVSDELSRDQSVTVCPVATNCTGYDLEEIAPIGKEEIETLLNGYICDLAGLIQECIDRTENHGEDIEAVILVGGGSQWYFVKDLLAGKTIAGNTINLPLICQNPDRIIQMPMPQESVAQGLVLSFLPLQIIDKETNKKEEEEKSEDENLVDGIIRNVMPEAMNTSGYEKDEEQNSDRLKFPYVSRLKKELSSADFSSIAQNAKDRIITAKTALTDKITTVGESINTEFLNQENRNKDSVEKNQEVSPSSEKEKDIAPTEIRNDIPEQESQHNFQTVRYRVPYSDLLRRELLSANITGLSSAGKNHILVIDQSTLYLFSGKYPSLRNFLQKCDVDAMRLFCFFFYDESRSGNGKEKGLLLSNIGIIWRGLFGPAKFVLWKDCLSAKTEKKVLILHTPTEDHRISIDTFDEEGIKRLTEIIDRTAQRLLEDTENNIALPDPFSKAGELFEKVANDLNRQGKSSETSFRIIGNGENRLDADNISSLKTFLKKNRFPMDENYYFWVDNSLLNNGWGNGAAIGAHGIAVKDKDAVFLLWDDIDGFRKYGKMIYIDNAKKPGISYKIDLKGDSNLLQNILMNVLESLREFQSA